VIDRFDVLYGEEFDLIERIFRAVIKRDGEALGGGLDQLHPNEVGRLSCLIVLSKLAQKVHGMHEQGIDSVEPACGYWSMSEQRLYDLATRLSRTDVERLWAGFGALDRMIRSGQEGHTRGFLGPPTGYFYEQLPSTITAEQVVEAMLE
jgi:hypothetical protein